MTKRMNKRVKKNSKKKHNAVMLSGSIILNDFDNRILLLYREEHGHYETPGGKVELKKDEEINEKTLWKNAHRELLEELGEQIEVLDYEYFAHTSFKIPDGRDAVAHKFVIHIDGTPRINEPNKFSQLDWIAIEDLHNHSLSPDLKIMLEKVKNIKD